MNPQSSPLLAGRVALERYDTTDHHRRPAARRRPAFPGGLARLIAAPVTRLIASRRSPARGVGALPARSGSDS
jgi:hypothetical protein